MGGAILRTVMGISNVCLEFSNVAAYITLLFVGPRQAVCVGGKHTANGTWNFQMLDFNDLGVSEA